MSDNPGLGKPVGSGRTAEVFACGTGVLKLYRLPTHKRSAFAEAAILALAESLGLPVPIVACVRQVGERWGILMSLAEGPTFAAPMLRDPALVPTYLRAMAALQARVHRLPGTQLPGLKAKLAASIQQAKPLGENRRNLLLERLPGLPDNDRMCHGDFHPLNILGAPGHEMLVDWPNACCGDPAADVCRSYVLMHPVAPDLASCYVDVYAEVTGESRDRVWRWLPVVAAARLAEDVPDETDGLLRMIRLF